MVHGVCMHACMVLCMHACALLVPRTAQAERSRSRSFAGGRSERNGGQRALVGWTWRSGTGGAVGAVGAVAICQGWRISLSWPQRGQAAADTAHPDQLAEGERVKVRRCGGCSSAARPGGSCPSDRQRARACSPGANRAETTVRRGWQRTLSSAGGFSSNGAFATETSVSRSPAVASLAISPERIKRIVEDDRAGARSGCPTRKRSAR